MDARRQPFVVGKYYEDRDAKQQFLRTIFDRTARHYEGIARWGWFGTGHLYRRNALRRAGVQPHMRVIDVASGTGAVARALLEIVADPSQVVCAEPSAGMIAEARKTVPVVHHQATAEALPVGDGEFDFVTMGFALRHVDDLLDTFREFHRVLKPGGKLLIMDVTLPERRVGRWFFDFYFRDALPLLTRWFSRDREAERLMRYYWETMAQMVPREDVVDLLKEAGFARAEHRVLAGCFSEYEAQR